MIGLVVVEASRLDGPLKWQMESRVVGGASLTAEMSLFVKRTVSAIAARCLAEDRFDVDFDGPLQKNR